MTTRLPALIALLPLSLLALWLAPDIQPLDRLPTAHVVDAGGPTLAVEASPAPVLCVDGEGVDDTPDDEGDDADAARGRAPHDPPTHLVDETTRARSAGPIYRVMRSGQAHRSAP